jgi:hypothetical protein
MQLSQSLTSYIILFQHVSGNYVPIIKSSLLYTYVKLHNRNACAILHTYTTKKT